MERIVLAYSGGLDTSVAIPWLKEQYRADIIAVTMDLGQGKELESVRDRALAAGAVRAHVLDLREEFARRYILPALKADALYEDRYPLATALGRPLIAQKLVEIADIERALPLRARLVRLVEILQSRLDTVFTLINALGMKGPPPDSQRHRLINDQFREAIVELVGDDRTALRVPPMELAVALRMLVFSSTHPIINDGNPLTAEQIVGILLDGLSIRGDRPC